MSKEKDLKFNDIYNEYKDYVFRTCMLYVSDFHIAEDCAQETFCKIYRKLGSFRREAQMKTWLTKICINTCRDKLRRLKKEVVSDQAEKVYENSLDVKLTVTEAVSSLPLEIRETVILYYYHELTQKEIAQLTHTKQPTVAYRIRRAKELLREKLGEDFYE